VKSHNQCSSVDGSNSSHDTVTFAEFVVCVPDEIIISGVAGLLPDPDPSGATPPGIGSVT
jgi:hypothetical protein